MNSWFKPPHRQARRCAATLAALLGTTMTAGERIAPDFAALAREALVSLPPPPPWQPAAAPRTSSLDELEAELIRFTDTPPRVNMVHTRLLRPEQAWVVAFARWFRSIQQPLKIRFRDQVWDCDDYANCFVAFADLLVLKAGGGRGGAGGLCVGRASVFYRRPFAGVRSGAHALVFVGTSEGLLLVEPQDGTVVSLREFPNRDTVEEVNF